MDPYMLGDKHLSFKEFPDILTKTKDKDGKIKVAFAFGSGRFPMSAHIGYIIDALFVPEMAISLDRWARKKNLDLEIQSGLDVYIDDEDLQEWNIVVIGSPRVNYVAKKLEGFLSKNLFSWDDVPGRDSDRLIEFLEDQLNIKWKKNVEIKKTDDNTVIVTDGKKPITLEFNWNLWKVIIKSNNRKIYECIPKEEENKRNIYDEKLKVRFNPGYLEIASDCSGTIYHATVGDGRDTGFLTMINNPWAADQKQNRIIVLSAGNHPVGSVAALELLAKYVEHPRSRRDNNFDNRIPAKVVMGCPKECKGYRPNPPDIPTPICELEKVFVRE